MKKGAVLKVLGDFQIMQFIIHTGEKSLGACIVQHQCPQHMFRERLEGILASPDVGNFHRFESLDPGKLGDRLGIQIGDIYIVYRDGGFALGTLDELKRDLESGSDFALNVLRDTRQTNEFEKCDDAILNDDDDDDSITSIESNVHAGRNENKKRSRNHVEKTLSDTKKCLKEFNTGIPGYRVLEFDIKDHYKKPFGAELIQESVSDSFRKQTSHFLDPNDTMGTLTRFYRVVKDKTPYKYGLRENDILLLRFKGTWLLGTEGTLRKKLKANRPFRIHVLRKDDRVGSMNGVKCKKLNTIEVQSAGEGHNPSSPSYEKQIRVPAMSTYSYSAAQERAGRKRRRSNESNKLASVDEKKVLAKRRKSEPPVLKEEGSHRRIRCAKLSETRNQKTTKDCEDSASGAAGERGGSQTVRDSSKGAQSKVIMRVPGHKIWKAHVKESDVPFGADMVEEECSPEFLGTMLDFFPAGSNLLCRYVYIEKGLQADTLGLKEGDILINSVKTNWQLGSKKDFQQKINRDRGFYLYHLRKCSDLNSESLEASALGYSAEQQSPISVVRRRESTAESRLERHQSYVDDVARVDSEVPQHSFYSKPKKLGGEEQPAQDANRTHAAPNGAHGELHVKQLQQAGSVKTLQQANKDGSVELEHKLQLDPDVHADASVQHSQRDSNEDVIETVPSSFDGLNLSELLQYISKQDNGADIRSAFDYTKSLLTPTEIEKFVCLGGLCHTFLLLTHPDEGIQTLGWKVVLEVHSHMPQCHSSLVALGIYRKIVQSLQGCETGRLFETLVEVLISPIVGTEASIRDFISIDGAIASVIMAIDRRLGSVESYISCCRFMANVLASRTGQS